ncbi:hypothetical protein [Vaginisenegalia massiliensis]|uniref:hypothetical protein n=1 Tax=Vaginisenegalia massiliensis TaxID=2058294 RepID=UPI000F531010|nr:hypothetical protein [Vaginisenegalia massiliensis]
MFTQESATTLRIVMAEDEALAYLLRFQQVSQLERYCLMLTNFAREIKDQSLADQTKLVCEFVESNPFQLSYQLSKLA